MDVEQPVAATISLFIAIGIQLMYLHRVSRHRTSYCPRAVPVRSRMAVPCHPYVSGRLTAKEGPS